MLLFVEWEVTLRRDYNSAICPLWTAYNQLCDDRKPFLYKMYSSPEPEEPTQSAEVPPIWKRTGNVSYNSFPSSPRETYCCSPTITRYCPIQLFWNLALLRCTTLDANYSRQPWISSWFSVCYVIAESFMQKGHNQLSYMSCSSMNLLLLLRCPRATLHPGGIPTHCQKCISTKWYLEQFSIAIES